MASAWVYQDDKQVKKHGAAKASWYVGWFDPEGKKRCKSCGPGSEGKKNAERLRRTREAELITGTYQAAEKATWKDFRKEYDQRILAGMSVGNKRLTLDALTTFERIAKPGRIAAINTQTIDGFISKRRAEPGRREGDTISPATVNKDLRHIKAVLKIACEWNLLAKMPKIRMLREPVKLVRYITPEHFAALYQAADQAKRPKQAGADWWRGLIVFAYMTGWRISEIMALKRADLDLEAGTAITWHEDNKGKRDERVKLHALAVEHLRKLQGFTPKVFSWKHGNSALYEEFTALQQAAGIELPCGKKHKCTPNCHVYGFHDLRRAFATMNADRLTGDALQALMRHKSYTTTQRYIAMARQMDEAVESLHVPDLTAKPRKAGG